MLNSKNLGWILSSVIVLTACTSLQKDTSLNDIEIRPVMSVNHANGSPRIMYLLGRYHQGKLDYQKAIVAYERALAVKPDYIEVHNGLGVIYSIQGQQELSLQHFHKAIELAPQETYLYNNLGYAYLLHGNFAESIKALNKAILLDPENKSAHLNLAIAKEKSYIDNKAITSQLSPDDSTSHVTQVLSKIDTDEVEGNAIKFYENTGPRFAKVLNRIDDRIAEDGNSEKLNGKNIRIEVSNGNGITGMANKVSLFLQQYGVTNVKLTNHSTYQQYQTEIHYRPGNYHHAFLINQILPMPVKLIESNILRHSIQIKILLGQDLSRDVVYFNTKEIMQVSQQSIAKLLTQ